MATDPLATAVMVAYCDWDPTTVVTNETDVLDGNGSDTVFLPSLFVTNVASVVVTLDPDSGTTLDVTANIAQNYKDGTITLVSGWLRQFPEGTGNVAIQWSGGYATPPNDLTAALNSISNRIPKMGLTSAKIGTAAMTYAAQVAAGGLLAVEQMVLDKYRIPRVR